MKRVFASSVFALLFIVSTAFANPLTVFADADNPPASSMDHRSGVARGFAVEIVEAVTRAAGVDRTITPLPIGRALREVENAQGCVFPLNRTSEREARFKWVGPIASGGWALFARADAPIEPMNSIEDARPHLIGVRVNGAIESYLRSVGGLRIVTAAGGELIARQLAGGRIDLWATGAKMGPNLSESAGGVKRVLLLNRSEFWLACDRRVSDVIISDLDTALKAARARGEFEEAFRDPP